MSWICIGITKKGELCGKHIETREQIAKHLQEHREAIFCGDLKDE